MLLTRKFFNIIAIIAAIFTTSLLSCSKKVEQEDNSVKEIKFKQDKVSLLKSGTCKLLFNVYPTTAAIPEIEWRSKDESIAKVDQNGNVTAQNKIGKTFITISTLDNKFSDECEIFVSADVTKISLYPSSYSTSIKKSFKLTAKVEPSEANSDIIWSSDKDNIASVDKEGNVTTKNEGTAIITAKSAVNTYKIATCRVEVVPISIKLNHTSLPLTKNDTCTIVATISPKDAEKGILWSSNKKDIADVDANGKVTAKAKKGKAIITATSKVDTTKKATCEVDVTTKIIYCITPEAVLRNGIDRTDIYAPYNNTTRPILTSISVADDGTVYVIGYGSTYYSNSQKYKYNIILWKNGKLYSQFVMPDLHKNIEYLQVTKTGDYYYLVDNDKNLEATIHKNREKLYGFKNTWFTSVVIENNNVYACGIQGDEKVVLKNGVIQHKFSETYYAPQAMCVLNGNIYTAHYNFGTSLDITKNGKYLKTKESPFYGAINCMYVSEEDKDDDDRIGLAGKNGNGKGAWWTLTSGKGVSQSYSNLKDINIFHITKNGEHYCGATLSNGYDLLVNGNPQGYKCSRQIVSLAVCE